MLKPYLAALALVMATPAAAGGLEDALARGALRVCTVEAPPFAVRTPSGELIGHEVDIASRLASDLGLSLDLRPVPGRVLLDRLNAGDCDLAIAALALDTTRLLQVWMTNPYAESDIRVVASSKGPFRVDQLNVPDTAIGVVTGTLAADAARTRLPSATFREFPDLMSAQKALDDGAINALAFKEPVPTLTAAAAKPQRYAVGDGAPLSRTADGMAVRKGDMNLLNLANGWIAARRRDGFLDANRTYWMTTLDWMARLKPAAESR
ncbi:MAG: ABC transporter substrate-binding protein [Phenylobacterium sp.]|jgi:polar amino acid transport system substrate-binding protein